MDAIKMSTVREPKVLKVKPTRMLASAWLPNVSSASDETQKMCVRTNNDCTRYRGQILLLELQLARFISARQELGLSSLAMNRAIRPVLLRLKEMRKHISLFESRM
jgi:hypothetical protein